MKPLDILLTKEAFNEHATRLREEQAREYGMTLEEWDTAVLTGQTISYNTQQSTDTVTGSYKPKIKLPYEMHTT
jgi:hypothetical protein